MKKDKAHSPVAELRPRTVKEVKKRKNKTLPRAQAEQHQLVHEIEVQKIEREMQNEQSRQSADETAMVLEKYHNLYDFAPLGYFTLDRKGIICELNLIGAALLGQERSALVGRNFQQFVSPDALPAYYDCLQKIFACDAKVSCEVVLNPAELPPRFVQIEGIVPDYGEHCLVLVVDITERRRMEDAQLFLAQYGSSVSDRDFFESLARYLAEKLEVDYVCIDRLERDCLAAQTVAVYFDGKFEDNVRYTLRDTPCGDVVGKIVCTFPRDVRHLFPRDVVLQEMLAESYVGTTLWSSQGQPIGLIAIISRKPIVNIKMAESILKLVSVRAAGELERRQAEKALRESEELFRMTFDKSPIGTAIVSLDGKIIRANGQLCRMLGYTAEEITGLTLQDITDPGDIEIDRERLRQMSSGSADYFTMVKRYISKDGSIIWGRLSAGVVKDAEGHPLHSIGMVEDITEPRRMERELQERTIQQEAANRELESFSYSVSHDLRAPLRAIDGYSRMILKRIGDQFDDDTRRQFGLIRENAQAMGQLIDDLLAFAHLGRKAVLKADLDQNALVRDLWQEMQNDMPARDIRLKIDSLPTGVGDRALVKQVFANLLANAVKFSRIRERVVIEVGGYPQDNENVYYVKDNGIGFDMKYYDKLFAVFQRLHGAEEFEGTGIGLALVQRIIHRHGGRVWAVGEVDKGAVFYFTLPNGMQEASENNPR